MPPKSATAFIRRLVAPLLGCLTLGLAPFVPEPHVVGKLRWVMGGARGMRLIDWFDLMFHAAPWIWLLATVALGIAKEKAVGRSPWPPALLLASLVGAVVCVLWSVAPG